MEHNINDILTQYAPLIRKQARLFSRTANDREDLCQVARMGIIEAMPDFDPMKGHLSSYVQDSVRFALLGYQKDSQFLCKQSSRRSQKIFANAPRILRELGASDGDNVDAIAAIAERLDVTTMEVSTVLSAIQPSSNDFETEALVAEEVESELHERRRNLLLEKALASIRPTYAFAIRERFLAGRRCDDIAEELGLSGQQIRNRINLGMEELRDQFTDLEFTDLF
jgi:RNA polymerase sigma factor (sigma-70 family)